MDVKIEDSWKEALKDEFNKAYFTQLTEFVRSEYESTTVFPPAKLIFNAFDQCPFNDTKVVIIGQDPYHDVNQAHGLCFSVNEGVKIPPSLRISLKNKHKIWEFRFQRVVIFCVGHSRAYSLLMPH